MRCTCLLFCFFTLGCGDDDAVVDAATSDVPATDAPAADAPVPDAESDAPPAADAGDDAPMMSDAGDDAPAMSDAGDDARTPDAGDDAPSAGPCEGTRMGAPCEPGGCGDLACAEGICMPPFSHAGGCGGFVGARCEQIDHPTASMRQGRTRVPA